MNILISNDDGIHAPGLHALAKAIAPLANITVMAPDRDYSGVSNALTLDKPIAVTELKPNWYSISGTPTDCVHLAITGFLDFEPDLVLSGINKGANLGDDVLYSGTVAAAVEGRNLGLPAIAFSVTEHACKNFDTAAIIAKNLVESLMAKPFKHNTVLNVNIPNKPLQDIKGQKATRLGYRHRAEPIIPTHCPRGRVFYWVGPAGKGADVGEGTDFHATENGYVSITPLQIDLTAHTITPTLANWLKGIAND